MLYVHVAVARSISNVVVNSLFYKSLREFKKLKKFKKMSNFGRKIPICVQTIKSVNILAFFVSKEVFAKKYFLCYNQTRNQKRGTRGVK